MLLRFADHGELEKSGRPFRCSVCQKNPQNGKLRDSISKLRRCKEDKWDFDEKDGAAFPIYLFPGGPSFGFCPAKIERDDTETVMIFNTLVAILITGTWPEIGGLNIQEAFWVDLVSEYGPVYDDMKFNQRLSQVSKLVASAFGGK